MTGTLESPYEAAPMGSPFFSAEEQRVFDAKLSEIVAHYPADRKSAAMLPALRLLQELKGWLSPDGMLMVAKALDVPPERAYEVATFYVMFHTEKPGKHVVDVCTNLSCSLWGAEDLLAYLVRLKEEKGVWTTTPSAVNRWWRQRAEMRLVEQGREWRIEGPGSERARVAYASEQNGRLIFRIHGQK